MTDTTETLDTLIAELESDIRFANSYEQADYARRLLKALTDLRTERDGLAAIVDNTKEALTTHETNASYDRLERILKAKNILDTAPTAALADRDARIWDEGVLAAGASWGHTVFARNFKNPYRAASRRSEAHEGDNTTHDSQTGADHG